MKVLFLCIGNTCRSQMAEGFALRHGGRGLEVRSAGTSAFGRVHPATISAMAEVGINISGQSSDQLTGEMLDWADTVVTLGCCRADEICPPGFSGRKIDWPIIDPFGGPPELFKDVRSDIERRVMELIGE